MPSARDLYLILRAQDQANAVLNSFSRAVRKAGTDTMLAQLEARKGAEAAALGQNRLEQATIRNSMAELSNENAIHRTQLTQALATGTTQSYVNAKQAAITNNERLIQTMRSQIIGHQDEALATRQNILNLDQEIATRKKAISAIEEHGSHMQNISNTMKSVSQTAATVGMGFAAAGVAGLAFFASASKAGIEYERQVAQTATQITGFSVTLEELGQVGIDVAKNVAVPFQEIQPMLYDIFSSMDVNLEQSKTLLTAFSKEAVAGQVSLQTAGRATISIMNAFHMPAENVNDVLDIMFQLVRKGVGTFEQFSSTIGRSIPSAVRAGQSVETLAAMLAFLTRNGLSAAMASASAGRAFDAMSNPATVSRLEAMGIKVRDLDGNFLPLVDTLQQFREKLMAMPGPERLQAITDVFKGSGGTIQARRFLDQILLKPGDLEQFKSLLGDMQNASGAFGDAYSQMADTVKAKTELLKNQWQILKITVWDAIKGALGPLIGIALNLLTAFNNLSPGTQRLIIQFAFWASVAGILVGSLFGIVAVIAGVVGALAVAGASIGGVILVLGGLVIAVGLVVAALALIGLELKRAYDKSEDFRAAVNRVKTDFWALGQMIKRSWKENVQPALDETARIFKEKVQPAWEDFWATVRDKVEPKIHEFIDWCRQNVDPVMKEVGRIIKEDINPQLEKMAEWWKKNKDWLEPLLGVMAGMVKVAAELVVTFGILVGLGGLKSLAGTLRNVANAMDVLGIAAHYVKAQWQEFKRVVADLQPINIAVSGAQWLQEKFNELQQALDKLKRWWDGLPFVNAITAELQRVKAVVTFMFGDLLVQFDTFFGDAKGKSSGGWGGIGSIFSGGMGSVRGILNVGFIAAGGIVGIGISDMLNRAGGIHGLRNIFDSAVTNARIALSIGIDGAVNIASSIGNRIANAVGSLGSVLWDAGQNVISGLIGGIQSMLPVLGGVLGAVGLYIAAHKGPKAYDLTILRPAGNAIMQGLINGINDMTPFLKTQLQGISAQISPNFMGATAPPAQPSTKNVTFNLTVNQADRSARQLAQDLGSELAGML